MKPSSPADTIHLQVATTANHCPCLEQFRDWLGYVLKQQGASGELTLRLVDEPESRSLNYAYRGKDKPTNVLAFPYEEAELIGDLILCAPIIAREAAQQQKTLPAHWAHLAIHGCLHCLGYDHIQEADRKIMEQQEIALLKNLGYSNPYEEEEN